MTYKCADCHRRVFPTRTDYVSDGRCGECGGTVIMGGG